MTYWIVVGSPENFQIAIRRGFDLFGFKSTRRRETSGMTPGDKLIFYLTGVMKFGGIATVTSEAFEDHKKIFKSEKKPGEDYPFRVNTKADIVLDEDTWLDVREWAPRMQYTKKWPVEHWRLAFQGNLHQIPESDYQLLEKEMRAQAGKAKPRAKAAAKQAVKATSRATRDAPVRAGAKRGANSASRARKRGRSPSAAIPKAR